MTTHVAVGCYVMLLIQAIAAKQISMKFGIEVDCDLD